MKLIVKTLKRLFMSIFVIFFIVSCEGDSDTGGDENLIGKWKYIHWKDTVENNVTTEGDWIHKCDTNYDYITFSENGTWEIVFYGTNCQVYEGHIGTWEKQGSTIYFTSPQGFWNHEEKILELTDTTLKTRSISNSRISVITYQKQ